MTVLELFAADGEWLKGNLHGHSTESDGKKSPAEVINWYADQGWNFIAITDHNKITIADGSRRGLVMLTGEELDFSDNGVEYHMLALVFENMLN